MKRVLWSIFLAAVAVAQRQLLTVSDENGNATSPLLYGSLYEDIYHSGDGGLYAELIRNRAFQGSSQNGTASAIRTTDYWHPVGDVSLHVDQSAPHLSSALPYHMRLDIDANATGLVGASNDGFFGMDVNCEKNYSASFYIRGQYDGTATGLFRNKITGEALSSIQTDVSWMKNEWSHVEFPMFMPSKTTPGPNNTFEFLFDSETLRGKSIYVNLLSLFKKTYKNRANGMREDLAEAFQDLDTTWIRLPGGNNLEGLALGEEWKWNETIGPLIDRPGRLGTWGSEQTDGFGLLEMMQWCLDMNQTVFLGVFAGHWLDGEVAAEAELQPYVDNVMNELEFLMGNSSTTFGAKRAALGYPTPFDITHIEIGNEDYLSNGSASYYAYRFNAFYEAIHAKYPNVNLISSTIPSPVQNPGTWLDLHIYENQDSFASEYDAFDNTDRKYPVIVGEYACIYEFNNSSPQVGAQTMGMALAEGIMLLGAERNSDVIKGTSYGALIKAYDEQPDTVAVIKHTADQILKTNSFYVSKLFSTYFGDSTLAVTTQYGDGIDPLYWSATKTNGGSKILKVLNYYGPGSVVDVVFEGPHNTTAEVFTLTSDSCGSVNSLPELGGETSKLTDGTLQEQDGRFVVIFGSECEVKVLIV